MKITFIIIATIATVLIIFYLTSCNNKANKDEKVIEKNVSKPKIYKTEENTYPELRQVAFSINPEKLGLNFENDKTIVYGVIMDWEMGGATASTISYATGDASLYLSSGGGVIGGGQHQNVSSAAKQFVSVAQKYLGKAQKTETSQLPDQNEIKFYLLTNKGIYLGIEKMENFENNSSEWMELFESGNKVLSELRTVSSK